METLTTKHFRFADFELDGVKRILSKRGKPIALNPKAFDLLLVLVESRGQVLTKDELLERVWPGQFIEEGNLRVHISSLRKVFGSDKNDHEFIVTVPGRGYSFVAELTEPTNGEIVVETHRFAKVVIEEKAAETTSRQLPEATRVRPRAFLVVGALAVTVVLAGLGYWLFLRSDPGAKVIKSIAVMPFVNESGNADIEYLSDGLTESLIGNLSQLPAISVKARSSVSRYKGMAIDVRDIGTSLSVDAVLTGRLVQRGDKLTLYVEFVEPLSEHVLWKADYNRSLHDIAALQSDLARDVANRLKAKLSGTENVRLAKYQSSNSEAYESYLKGVHFANMGASVDTMTNAVKHFQTAIGLDPEYTLAYVGLAKAYMKFGNVFGLRSPQDTFPKAREALMKAISIDGDFAAARGALGEYYLKYEWNWPAAEREFLRAVEIDPDNPEYYTELGSYYQSIGRFDDAVRARETARKLDPVTEGVIANVGYPHYYARRHDQAIEWYQKALELNPRYSWAYLWIGQSKLDMKRYEEAIDHIERAAELSKRNSRVVATLGHALAKAGKRAEALKVLNELQTRSKSEYVSPYFFAVVYAGLGDADKVFEFLENAREERQTYLFLLGVEPVFDDLRSDPRFQTLIEEIGIPE